jgi:hypothetical protein
VDELPVVLSLCTESRTLTCGDQAHRLYPGDAAVLEVIASNPRRAWSTAEIAAQCYLGEGSVTAALLRLSAVVGSAGFSRRHMGHHFLVYPCLVWIAGCPWCASHPSEQPILAVAG